MDPPAMPRGTSRGRRGTTRLARGISSRGGARGRGGRGSRSLTPVVARQVEAQPSPEQPQAPTRRRASKAPEPVGKPWSVNSMAWRPDEGALKRLETGEFSDATIMADGREWKVHRLLLSSRSGWFARAFENKTLDDDNVINLFPLETEFVDVLLLTLYSNRLPEQYLDVRGEHATFATYIKIFNLADQFQVETMSDDALSVLGQLADRYLEDLCSFDRAKSGREGVPEPKPRFPYQNLGIAILEAFKDERTDKRAQCLLANFVYAGRAVLLENQILRDIVERNVQLAAAMWHASQGRNLAGWLPNPDVISHRLRAFDHTKKTQHPDRCELCDDVFDSDTHKRVMFDPYKVVLRPAGYCAVCVDKHKDDPECLFRKKGKTDKRGEGHVPVIKPESGLCEDVDMGGIPSVKGEREATAGLGLQGPTMSTPAPPAPLSDAELMPPPPLPAKKGVKRARREDEEGEEAMKGE
ncbi:hypothetical protein QBC41DRAFT_385545 [Cercophora samala]|uniref:BTB domain-containing protein n=1 Tax=Cercophora samala TaxID=330535 RepID=A0AA39ZIB9_9PEZI|nr:hypothetical protein QBC41DRAFT_385545 [Cercophora samala]